jgi:hypothetical protein
MPTRVEASIEGRMLGAIDGAAEAAAELARRGRAFLSSEEGRELRKHVSRALILAAPLLGEFPVIRRTWAGRVLRYAGVSAIVIKGAEWLRDWEPNPAL